MIKRVVIVGAGAVGGCIAAHLDRANVSVLLVARGPHLLALQENGLTLQTPRRTVTLRLPAAAMPTWQEGDVAMMCVKSQDSAEVLATIPNFVPVICAQNGVENEALAAEAHPTVAMMAWIMAVHLSPGVVALYAGDCPGILDVGAVQGDPRLAAEVARVLRHAGFDSVARDDIMEWKRAKLISNLPGILQLCPAGFDARQAEALIAEGTDVFQRASLPFTELERFMARVAGATHEAISGRARPGGSLWQSNERGTPSEIDYLNGYVIRLGARLGVGTPVNRRLLAEVVGKDAL